MAIEIRTLRYSELGNSSYILIDRETHSAVVIDPVRDTDRYLEIARSVDVRITWALETHVHNDFVSGGRELVAENLTRLGASSSAGLRFAYHGFDDGDEIEIGSWRLRVLATPGHTPEHLAYLLLDDAGHAQALFSGGALMVGTAARTDLFGLALSWRFAHDLERSLKEKILSLPDDVVVYPTHGGGSFCAVGAGSALTTTIGIEKATNRLLAARNSRQFVSRSLTAGPYPVYYSLMRSLNQAGAPLIGPTPPPPAAIDLEDLDLWIAQGALIVDLRASSDFRSGHIPGSIAAAADGNVSGWIGWLVGPERALVLVADEAERGKGQIDEAQRKLLRIGYDRIVGQLKGGLTTWVQAGRFLVNYETTTAAGLAKRLDSDEAIAIVDVREAGEWHTGHVPGSVNLPVHDILTTTIELPKGVPLAVHCGHDYRATLGASLLERSGYRELIVLEDGFDGWEALEIDEK